MVDFPSRVEIVEQLLLEHYGGSKEKANMVANHLFDALDAINPDREGAPLMPMILEMHPMEKEIMLSYLRGAIVAALNARGISDSKFPDEIVECMREFNIKCP